MKRYVVGDIHGNYKALKQVLEKVNFDYDNDILISLGDIADGYSDVPLVIEEFIKIKNLIWCLGNHDKWTQEWFSGQTNMEHVGPNGEFDHIWISHDAHMWLSQGGKATYKAYIDRPELMIEHRDFWLKKPVPYYVIDEEHVESKKCFVHAGWVREFPIETTLKKWKHYLWWDRDLWYKAMSSGKTKLKTEDDFDKVFIGHTSTNFWDSMEPMKSGGIWNIDTGAGWHGKLTIMNIDTEEYFQSDLATELYPNERPRK